MPSAPTLPSLNERADRLLGRSTETLAPATKPEPPVLSDDALHGLAGDVVRTIAPHSEASPAAIFFTFLTAAGNAIGPTPRAMVGAVPHGTNEFSLIVGSSAKARKGQSLRDTMQVIAPVDPEWHDRRIVHGIASGEGIINAVRDPERDSDGLPLNPGQLDRRLFAVEPEFSRLLAAIGRDGSTVSAVLRQAWDGSPLSILTKKDPLSARSSHVSVLGHITEQEFAARMPGVEVTNGFLNRFLLVHARRSQLLPDGGRVPEGELLVLRRRLSDVAAFGRALSAPLDRDREAAKLWEKVYALLQVEPPGLLGAATARADAHVFRLSLLLAALDCSPVIRAEHVFAAFAAWEYCESTARYLFGTRTGSEDADRILDALRRSGPLTTTDVHDFFHRNRPRAQIEAALDLLRVCGLAHPIENSDTGGRPATLWLAGSPPAGPI